MPEPYVSALAAAAVTASLQGVLARWRDLAPTPAALGGAALILAGQGEALPWAGLAVVAALTAAGQWRSAATGNARPELLASTVAVVVALLAVANALPGPGLRSGLAGAAVLVGLLATGVSVARLGARRRPVRWTGEIPVSGPAPSSGPQASQAVAGSATEPRLQGEAP